MIDVSIDFTELFTMVSCGVITGLVMYFSQAIIAAIIRVFVVIANN